MLVDAKELKKLVESISDALAEQLKENNAALLIKVDASVAGMRTEMSAAIAELRGQVAQEIDSQTTTILGLKSALDGLATTVKSMEEGATAHGASLDSVLQLTNSLQESVAEAREVHAQTVERLDGAVEGLRVHLEGAIADAEQRCGDLVRSLPPPPTPDALVTDGEPSAQARALMELISKDVVPVALQAALHPVHETVGAVDRQLTAITDLVSSNEKYVSERLHDLNEDVGQMRTAQADVAKSVSTLTEDILVRLRVGIDAVAQPLAQRVDEVESSLTELRQVVDKDMPVVLHVKADVETLMDRVPADLQDRLDSVPTQVQLSVAAAVQPANDQVAQLLTQVVKAEHRIDEVQSQVELGKPAVEKLMVDVEELKDCLPASVQLTQDIMRQHTDASVAEAKRSLTEIIKEAKDTLEQRCQELFSMVQERAAQADLLVLRDSTLQLSTGMIEAGEAMKEMASEVAELTTTVRSGQDDGAMLRTEFDALSKTVKSRLDAIIEESSAALTVRGDAMLQVLREELKQADGEARKVLDSHFAEAVADLKAGIEASLGQLKSDAETTIRSLQTELWAVDKAELISRIDAALVDATGKAVTAVEELRAGIDVTVAAAAQSYSEQVEKALGLQIAAKAVGIENELVDRLSAQLSEQVEKLEDQIDSRLRSDVPEAVLAAVNTAAGDMEPRLMVGLTAKLQAEVDRIPRPRDGKDGKDGKDGASARIAPPVPYEPGKVYEYGSWVVHAGGVWHAARATDDEPSPDSPCWDCLAPGITAVEPVLQDDGRTVKLHIQLSSGAEFVNDIKLPIPVTRGVFKAGTEYSERDIVLHDGSWWEAQKSGELGKPGTTPDWKLQVKHGKDGRAGKDMPAAAWTMRGAWAMDTVYKPGDIVEHAGVHWLNLKSTTDRPPFQRLVSNDVWLKLGS